MNIVSLFPCRYDDKLLLNLGSDSILRGWNSRELFQEVSWLSGALKSQGVETGNRVLLLSGNLAETYAFMLAAMNIGAVAVPLNPGLARETLQGVIRSMNAVCCLSERPLPGQLSACLPEDCIRVILESACADSGTLTYQQLLDAHIDCENGDFPAAQQALLIHSSGSQGRPKVISYSHQQLFFYFHYHDLVHRQFAETPGKGGLLKPLISVFHPSHLAAFSMVMQAFLMRRPTCLLAEFNPAAYLHHLSGLGCHLSVLVPSMYTALLREAGAAYPLDFPAFRLAAMIGEAAHASLAQALEARFAVKAFCGYGLSECLPGIAHDWQALHEGTISPGSCGKQLCAELRLVDRQGRAAEQGELWVRNPTVHACYLDDSLNRQRLTRDGWLKTGDLFRRDSAGNYFHQGRVDDMFVCNGRNIYPAEIEAVLCRHPAVKRAVAAPLLMADGRTQAGVLLESGERLDGERPDGRKPDGEELDTGEVLSFYLRHGARHAIPGFVCAVERLPELGPGKLDRRAVAALLREKYAEQYRPEIPDEFPAA